MLQIPPSDCLFLVLCSDDSKGSPEPVTHLQWDHPYYDIARHHIVEVAGRNLPVFSFDVFAAGLRKIFSNRALGTSAVCHDQVAMTSGTERTPNFLNVCDTCNFPLTSSKLGLLLGSCWLDYIIVRTQLLLLNCFRYGSLLYPEHKSGFCLIMPQKLCS